MARITTAQYSFARGMVSKKLHGAANLESHYLSMEVQKNFVTSDAGTMVRRPGFGYIGQTKNDGKAHLVPFIYSADQAYMLEFGDYYIRAWANGGQVIYQAAPFDIATPFSYDELSELSYVQRKDVMWLVHPNHRPHLLKRVAANQFVLEYFETRDGPYFDSNTDMEYTMEFTAGGSLLWGRATASDLSGSSAFGLINNYPKVGSVLKIWDGSKYQNINIEAVTTVTNGTMSEIELNSFFTDWDGPSIPATKSWTIDGWGPGDTNVMIAVAGNYDTEKTRVIAKGYGTLYPANEIGPFHPVRDIGRHIRILEEDTNAAESASVEERFKWHTGKIIYVDDHDTAMIEWSGGDVPASTDWRLGRFYGGSNPALVGFLHNRLVYADYDTICTSWAENFDYFAPSNEDSTVDADNAITLTLTSSDAGRGASAKINFMAAVGYQFVVGSDAGLFTVEPADGLGSAYSATDLPAVRLHDSVPCSNTKPANVRDGLVFANMTNQNIFATEFADSSGRLKAVNIGSIGSDLLEKGINGLAYQQHPYSILWIALKDGGMAGLTIQPEQEIQAFHYHEMGGGGVIENIANLSSSAGDQLFAVVKRMVDGNVVRTVERMADFPKLDTDLLDCNYLDCHLRYEGNSDPDKWLRFKSVTEESFSTDGKIYAIDTHEAYADFYDSRFKEGDQLMIHSGWRWHTVNLWHDASKTITEQTSAITVGYMTIYPEFVRPNDYPGGPEMLFDRFKLRSGDEPDTGFWELIEEDEDIDINQGSYVTFNRQPDWLYTTRWSYPVTTLSGLDHMELREVDVLANGYHIKREVSGGKIDDLPDAHIALVGYSYESIAKTLSINVGIENGSPLANQRPVYEVVFDLYASYEFDAGTGLPSEYSRMFKSMNRVPINQHGVILENMPPRLYDGQIRVYRSEQGKMDDPAIAWRQSGPYPLNIRRILMRVNGSGGR